MPEKGAVFRSSAKVRCSRAATKPLKLRKELPPGLCKRIAVQRSALS
jgi:hypothetical protein